MRIDQYEEIICPGEKNIRIPICKHTQGPEEGRTGVYLPDWVIKIDDAGTQSTLSGYEEYTELMGWYCESSRHVNGDSVNNLYTAGTLWHSDIYIVMENGQHNAYITKSVSDGTITETITIVRLVRMDNELLALQTLEFSTCHWCGVHSHMDWIIARFTACQRSNTVHSYDQDGIPIGSSSVTTNYTENTVELMD